MDTISPAQRAPDPLEVQRMLMTATKAGIWGALPGIVVSFDPVAVTAQVQPAIRGVRRQAGVATSQPLPVLPDVPVVFPRGGGATLTFPVAAGDECLIVFAGRAIDAWWAHGGVQDPVEPRLHDLSDCFAIVGPQSQAKKIGGISTTAVQLRSDDGQAFVELNPGTHAIRVTTTGNIDATAGGEATVTAPTITLAGNVHITGTLLVDQTATLTGAVETGAAVAIATTLSIDGKDFGSHVHGGVETGSHDTGGVV